MLTVSTWNVNGWTDRNARLRAEILSYVNSDIICVSETHLKGDLQLDMNNYVWYGFNRGKTHIKAPRASGGVGIFIKASLLDVFSVSIVDKTCEEIL